MSEAKWQCPACGHINTTPRRCEDCYYLTPASNKAEAWEDAKADAVETLRAANQDLLVRGIARRGDDDDLAQALYTLLGGGRQEWTHDDWVAEIEGLDVSDVKLGDWLDLNT